MRQNFSIVKKAYNKLGKKNIRLTQSNLMLIRPILLNTTTYDFPVTENEIQNLLPEEVRLNINDEFVATHVGIYLRATASFLTNSGKKFFTYAPVQQSALALGVQPLYDGFMRIAVNNVNFVDKWGVKKHEYIPVASQLGQRQAVELNGATEPNARYSDDGTYAVSPMVTLSGAKKNSVQLILPKALTTPAFDVTNNSGELVHYQIDSIAIEFFGYLGQNGAKFQ
jgi:hypothetical protein